MANGDHPPACPAYYVPADIPKYDPVHCRCVEEKPMRSGEHRFLHGEPITILWRANASETWFYADGHIEIHEIKIEDVLPLAEE